MVTQPPKTSNELAEERTDLAVKRTLMGADRTLMAWVRTALSMISFGFTIYKVLQGMQEGDFNVLAHNFDPRSAGMFLTALGTVSMLLGSVEYWFTVKGLRELAPIPVWRPAFIMAIIIAVMGLFVFVSIITKLL
jgi:putative membrane protein